MSQRGEFVVTGFPLVASSITLLQGKKYVVTMAVQATPRGTIVELMTGTWLVPAPTIFALYSTLYKPLALPQITDQHVISAQVVADVIKEFAPSARCSYNGTAIASLTAGATGVLPGEWETFVATVPVHATAAQNGTALQLRITPPASPRALGATIWFDNVTVVED